MRFRVRQLRVAILVLYTCDDEHHSATLGVLVISAPSTNTRRGLPRVLLEYFLQYFRVLVIDIS